jgi:arylsulfatase A-like enzyme
MPTLAELCGGEVPASCNGVSFAATLRGEDQGARAFLYREFAGYRGWQAVWQGDYKLVRKNMHKKPKTELYDLSEDTQEQRDLAGEMPERVAAMMKVAAREHAPSTSFPLRAIDK